MRKRVLSLLLALCLTLALAPAASAAKSFSDVPSGHWAYDAVQTCVEQGAVTGFEDGRFLPDYAVKGSEFVVMLTRTFYPDKVANMSASAGAEWYVPYMQIAEDVGMLKDMSFLPNIDMTRYDMAQAIYNICQAHGKTVDSAQISLAEGKLTDSGSILSYCKTAVLSCVSLGIINGMDDGAFHGMYTMTRAQACIVITRTMDLLGTTPAQPEQPETPEQSGNGKLANGKDATVENVLEIMEQVKRDWPEGTKWDTSTKYDYPTGTKVGEAFSIAAQGVKSMGSAAIACGGYAAMVSDTIFGINATGREITNMADIRPGDLIFKFNNKDHNMHIAVVLYTLAPDDPANANKDGRWVIGLAEGNCSDSVKYSCTYTAFGSGKENANPYSGEYYKFVTRYPD